MRKNGCDSPRILVVEDETGFREMISTILDHYGYDVIQAGNGRDAISMAREKKPDLILLDIAMPQVDGWDVIRTLKASNETRQTKICFLTALEAPENMNYALQQGAVGYIVKTADGFSVTAFREKIESMLAV